MYTSHDIESNSMNVWKDVNINSLGEFTLSEKHLEVFESLLENLKNLLIRKGFSGLAYIKDINGLYEFTFGENCLYYNSANNTIISNGLLNSDDRYIIGDFLFKTMNLIYEFIPFDISVIRFTIDCKSFTRGEIKKSMYRQGFVEIMLLYEQEVYLYER